ncbi:MAG: succinate dehydrogenase/fumarate reductase iron-sulfur subunit [Candidatus Cloacimonadota bacterium]|nr:MAG: succinate dehydrogenase/fumarate reductase iron-sulfur subunit [Candidatus Cloacimonadota bacterium]PIE77579.1 MAG: succinate dehydrogenase/fumarate reductase iron-sulfur subunit [Candidatus Delongbacteria bacterium]
MSLNLKIWRQNSKNEKGKIVKYKLDNVSPDISFLEMLDQLNEKLIKEKDPLGPIAFDHDCREGICGMCSLVINGMPHGPEVETTTCQLHMRKFKDGDTIVVEPFRAKAFPVMKDLVIDRSAFDSIIEAGGYISVNTGNASDANATPVPKKDADLSMDAASCIGCGACVASCKNASAMLFVSAKISQFALLPQGKVEAKKRVKSMIKKMDQLGFGNCTNEKECEATCPKGINITNIARMNREMIKAVISMED